MSFQIKASRRDGLDEVFETTKLEIITSTELYKEHMFSPNLQV